MPLAELAGLVPDGATVALGGSFLHRGPFAFVRELIRQHRTALEIIKQSPGYDIDILCRACSVARVRAGIVAMEGHLGLAPAYRRAVEQQQIELEEHACMTLTAGLRAAAYGIPFQPVGGVHGSDLPALNRWASVPDPYGSGQEVWVIPAIRPDFAVIHVNEANEMGDARVYGTSHWDRILSRAGEAGARRGGNAGTGSLVPGAPGADADSGLHGGGGGRGAERGVARLMLAALRGGLPRRRSVHADARPAGRTPGGRAGVSGARTCLSAGPRSRIWSRTSRASSVRTR